MPNKATIAIGLVIPVLTLPRTPKEYETLRDATLKLASHISDEPDNAENEDLYPLLEKMSDLVEAYEDALYGHGKSGLEENKESANP
jgi:hypothetical protein